MNNGPTKVEVLITVIVVAILAAVAIPSFIKARNEALEHLRIIEVERLNSETK